MKGWCGSNADRISNLPRDVMQLILTFLPVKDAAKTATLSKQWRENWRANTQLVFDRDFSRMSKTELYALHSSKPLMLEIFKALLVPDGPITKFELIIPGLKPCPDIMDLIVVYLSKKHVQEFLLAFSHHLDDDGYPAIDGKVPPALFSARQLNCLKLHGCEFTAPSWFLGFSNLTFLDLTHVIVSPNFYGDFLPKCPLLQSLMLYTCGSAAVESHFKAELVAPSLKVFESNVWNICFKHTPLLSVVSIGNYSNVKHCEHSNFNEYNPDMVAAFASLRAIQKLVVGAELLQFFASGNVPFILPTLLHQLKAVQLESIVLYRLSEARVLVCLITSSPNLQNLSIWSSSAPGLPQTEAIDSLQLLLEADNHSTASCFQCLEELRLDAILGNKVELDLLRFALATAPLLRRIYMKPAKELDSKKGHKFLKNVTQYKRASKEAEVIYNSDDEADTL
ncbi:unnamed protein product [Linum tenue]|uniref:F-box domain-containing protein n=1 Tax=Linum tenue TaxID=586396 RepID=A0AAV0NIR4_9ROSI|nr:unnamed protein product [Linum tenue]